MKKNWILEFNDTKTNTKDCEKLVTSTLKEMGHKAKDIKTVNFYFNAAEGKVYFAALLSNGAEITGRI